MYVQKIKSYWFVTALLIGSCVPGSASVVVYTDRLVWQSATSNVNTIGFEGIAPQGGIVQFGAAGVTIGSVTFQGFDNTASTQADLEVNNAVNWGGAGNSTPINWATGAVLQGPAGNLFGQHIVATLPTGVFAVGSDIMLYDGSSSLAETITVQLSTGTGPYNAQTISGFSTRGFIGFVSTTQLGSITFFPSSDSAPHLLLDNFSTGGQAVAPAPEAGTMLLCGVGLLLMVWLVRRNSNSDAVRQSVRLAT